MAGIGDPGLKDANLAGWFQQETGELLKGFPILAGDSVLDIGCGDGAFALFCARQGARVTLADTDAKRVAAAAEHFRNEGFMEFKALVGDAEELKLDSEYADKLIAMEVLEHVDSPSAVLEELVRLGRPGALYLITVPSQASEALQSKLAPSSYFDKPNHIHIFDDGTFQALVEDTGLVVKKTHRYGFFHSLWWAFFWTCRQDLAPPWHPLLRSWTDTWARVLESSDGPRIKRALDQALPKSQAIIAEKPLQP